MRYGSGMWLWNEVEDGEENLNVMFQFFRYKMAEEMRNDVMENIHVCYNYNVVLITNQ